MKKKISSPLVPDPPPQTWSNYLVVGNQVFIAGMVASGPSGLVGGDSMYAQAQAIFIKIKHLMEAAGGAFTGNFPFSTLVEVEAVAMLGAGKP